MFVLGHVKIYIFFFKNEAPTGILIILFFPWGAAENDYNNGKEIEYNGKQLAVKL